MVPAPAPGNAPYVPFFMMAFGAVLALLAAFMFFAIEGWPFALLCVSQLFIALGALSLGRRLHKELGTAHHGHA